MEQRRKAPWPDYAGNPIHEGDTIEHPSGERGIVRLFMAGESPADQWRVDYGDFPQGDRLCLQIGAKGQAVVVPPNAALSGCRADSARLQDVASPAVRLNA